MEYVDRILWKFPEETNRMALMPVADYLFKVRTEPEAMKLEEERAIAIGHVVAQ